MNEDARGLRFLKREDAHDIGAGRYGGVGTTALLIDDAGQILLQLRDDIPTIHYPGYWCTLGGAFEPGETAEEAIRRELLEEIGHSVDELELYGQLIDRYEHDDLILVFLTRINVPVDELVLGEGQELRYFSKEELPELKISPHLKEVVLHYFFGEADTLPQCAVTK